MIFSSESRQLRFGISSFGLHILAMLFMLLDHMWATVIPGADWLTCVGRMAFPLFAFLLTEGFRYSSDRKKYGMRLLFGAIFSEIPFNLMYGGTLIYPYHQNVIWTFLLAYLVMCLLQKLKDSGKTLAAYFALVVCGIAAYLLGFLLMLDYYGYGVLTVLVFYTFYGTEWWRKALCFAFLFYINAVLMGGMYYTVILFGESIDFPQQAIAVFSFLFILLYNGKKGIGGKVWRILNYGFYPVHMLILAIVSLYLM